MPYVSLVRFHGGRQSDGFITWLAASDGFKVKSKLLRWGILDNDVCELCRRMPETRDHWFFDCGFSNEVMRIVLQEAQLRKNHDHGRNGLAGLLKYRKGRLELLVHEGNYCLL